MDVSENAKSSDSGAAVYDDGPDITQGPQKITRLGRPVTFDMNGWTGTANEQAAIRKKALRRILEEGGHKFGDDVSEGTLLGEFQKLYPGRRIRIIYVNPHDRQSVLKGMKYIDKCRPASRDRLLDCAIANLGMLDQDKDRDKLCEAIAKNRHHLRPQHEAALEGVSRDANVAQALAKAGYVIGTGNSYADMAKSDHDLKPLVEAHGTNLPMPTVTNEASMEQKNSKRQDMVRSREVLGRGSDGLSL